MGDKEEHGRDAHATDREHGQDAHATEVRRPGPLVVREGAYLPHWTRERCTYFVTFRLEDCLPASVVEAWRVERWHIVALAEQMGRELTYMEQARLRELFGERIEKWLDMGSGECHMNDPRVADLVRDALLHFDGTRYDLHAWCVMPNHVHVVVQPATGRELAGILHAWKSFTSKEANKILGRKGIFWQPEYYDHLVRDWEDLARVIAYTLANPGKAGLVGWK
jgi:menaquinone-specific isochorismate synthase